MRKSYFISMIALLLTIAVFTVAFSLYRQDADNREVTIGFGEIAELTVGGSTSETSVIGPESTGSFTVNLSNAKTNEDVDADLYTHGRFYVEVLQKTEGAAKKLADEVIVTATVLDGAKAGTVISNNDLVKVGETIPKGFVCELTAEPIRIEVSYALSDNAKTNFLDYAEQEVSLLLHWDFCESNTIKVNVCKPSAWADLTAIYYTIDGPATKLNYAVNEMWATIEVENTVKQIYFTSTEDSTDMGITIILEDVTAKEVWVTLDDERVHTTNPEL